MTEKKRLERNRGKLKECYPSFRLKVEAIIKELTYKGYRPRIQEAWRSTEDQLFAYEHGYSKVRYGFHNVTGERRVPEALAVDILDDDHPLNPSTRYMLALALAASKQKLTTGIAWGLPANLVYGITTALQNEDIDAAVKVGWDPTHVEPTGITPAEAKVGKRPA